MHPFVDFTLQCLQIYQSIIGAPRGVHGHIFSRPGLCPHPDDLRQPVQSRQQEEGYPVHV